MHRMLQYSAVAVVLALVAGTAATIGAEAKYNKVLTIGADAPKFDGTVGTDGKTYGLDSFKDSKAVVVVFTGNHCPVAIAYEERFKEFAKEYGAKGVSFVAINVNDNASDNLEANKQRAEEQGFNFPYAYDATQQSAKAFGATVTPHLFVLDGNRKIVYMGAFDDNMNAAKVEKHYIKDAVDAVLAGKTPEVAETQPKGCGIGYKKKAS